MDSSFWFDAISLEWSIVYISGSHRLWFSNKIVFLSMKIVIVLANSRDPDGMLHHVVFHLGLHCLSKYRPPDKSVYRKNIFVSSNQKKHMMWVLKRTASMSFTLIKFPYLGL